MSRSPPRELKRNRCPGGGSCRVTCCACSATRSKPRCMSVAATHTRSASRRSNPVVRSTVVRSSRQFPRRIAVRPAPATAPIYRPLHGPRYRSLVTCPHSSCHVQCWYLTLQWLWAVLFGGEVAGVQGQRPVRSRHRAETVTGYAGPAPVTSDVCGAGLVKQHGQACVDFYARATGTAPPDGVIAAVEGCIFVPRGEDGSDGICSTAQLISRPSVASIIGMRAG